MLCGTSAQKPITYLTIGLCLFMTGCRLSMLAPKTADLLSLDPTDDEESVGSVSFLPTSLTLIVNQSFTIATSGGTDCLYQVTSGNGSISGASDTQFTFTAGGTSGTATVRAACSDGFSGDFTININDSLRAIYDIVAIKKSETWEVKATGGIPPYSYAVTSGTGSIDSDGEFTAPNSNGIHTVNISDSDGNSATSEIHVIPSTDFHMAANQIDCSPNGDNYAEGAAIGSVSDCSGNGNTLTSPSSAASPTLALSDSNFNDRPVLNFDATAHAYLSTPANVAAMNGTTFTAFSVVGAITGGVFNVYREATGDGFVVKRLAGVTSASNHGTANKSSIQPESDPLAALNLFSVKYGSNCINIPQFWINTVAANDMGGACVNATLHGAQSRRIFIGAHNISGVWSYQNGPTSEIMFYKSTLSDTDRHAVECYLQTKYGQTPTSC